MSVKVFHGSDQLAQALTLLDQEPPNQVTTTRLRRVASCIEGKGTGTFRFSSHQYFTVFSLRDCTPYTQNKGLQTLEYEY